MANDTAAAFPVIPMSKTSSLVLFSVLMLTLGAQPQPPVSASMSLPAAPPPMIDVGSDGSDGAFAPTQDIQIDLATSGHYDPVNWAVVFNYTSVNIPAGVTVTFHNHPSRAPVVWLSQGSVTIDGRVDLSGHTGTQSGSYSYSEPGPGGFRGGTNSPGSPGPAFSAGFGPGAGSCAGQGALIPPGSHATGNFPYGSSSVRQLLGGSGGATYAGEPAQGGGGGGGAILIAANSTIAVSVSGLILANGGSGIGNYSGGGSGGAVRLLADEVLVAANRIFVAGGGSWAWGTAGSGRIRIEANSTNSIQSTPPASVSLPGSVFPPPGSPALRIALISTISAPADPRAGLGGTGGGAPDVSLTQPGLTTVVINAENVPLNSTVFLRVGKAHGDTSLISVTNPLVGTLAFSTTSIDIDLSSGASALQARAVFP